MKIIITLFTILSCNLAMAGDASFYTSLGFSKTGKYYAFIQEGVYDGLGAFWLELGIIDVKANKYVGRKKLGGEDEMGNITLESDRPQMLASLKADLHFDAFGFSEKPREEVKIYRPHTDLSQYTDTVFTLAYWAQGGASTMIDRFSLLLDEIKAPVTQENQWCEDWYGNNMIELRMEIEDGNVNPPTVKDLQIDTAQPEVRQCSFDYSIRYIFVHKNSMSVVLNYRTPGFEGPNDRFMVVTSNIYTN